MKIVYICDEYPPLPHGGIGVFVKTLAEGMVSAGHEVTVVGLGRQSSVRCENGVIIVTLPEMRIRGISWVLNRIRLYNWLKKRALSGNCDLVEVPEFNGLLPFKFKACPVIVRLHLSSVAICQEANRKPKLSIKWCESRTLLHNTSWIGVSKYILQLTKQVFSINPKRETVIYNPVCLPTENKIEIALSYKYLLFAGTVSERKGAVILAEACRYLMNKYAELHVVFAGLVVEENGERTDLRIKKILGPEVESRLHFLGRVTHETILAYMRRATVFVYPSRLEAFSLVPLEAMVSGVPVVYTTASSGPEAIEDQLTGLLADPYSAEDIAKKIERILVDPAFGRMLACNAAKVVADRFNMKRCIDETLAFYSERETLGAHGRGQAL